MKKYRIIGLTGQSGAGKSTVAEFMKGDGICVINADLLVARLYNSGSVCIKSLSSAFGAEIINCDGSLNRPVLAQKAFSSKKNTELLNSIVHPFVIYEFLREIKAAAFGGAELVVFDAPQLFECNADMICDVIISVTADLQTRIERICRRDKISREQALQRVNAQYDEDFFRKNADYIINNNHELNKTQEQIKEILSELRPNRGD